MISISEDTAEAVPSHEQAHTGFNTTRAASELRDWVLPHDRIISTRNVDAAYTAEYALAHANDGAPAYMPGLPSVLGCTKALSEPRCGLQTLLDQISDIVAVFGESGLLRYLNPAGKALLGVRADAPLLEIMLSARQPENVRQQFWEEAVPAALRAGIWSGDSALLADDGRHIPLSCIVIAHRDDNGNGVALWAIMRDAKLPPQSATELQRLQDQVKHLGGRLAAARELERHRIARDLHDGIGQSLSAIKYAVEATLCMLERQGVDGAVQILQMLPAQVNDALSELRRLALDARHAAVRDFNLCAALSSFLETFQSIYQRIRVQEQQSLADEGNIPMALKITIYRIVKEAINNVAKHSSATNVIVVLKRVGGAICLLIEDNGVGFDTVQVCSPRGRSRGLGLENMRERATCSGAKWLLDTAPGQGTRIRVCWPEVGATSAGAPVWQSRHVGSHCTNPPIATAPPNALRT